MSETPHTHPFPEPEPEGPGPRIWIIHQITIITPDNTVYIRNLDIRYLPTALTVAIKDILSANHLQGFEYPIRITVKQIFTSHPETIPFDPLNPEG